MRVSTWSLRVSRYEFTEWVCNLGNVIWKFQGMSFKVWVYRNYFEEVFNFYFLLRVGEELRALGSCKKPPYYQLPHYQIINQKPTNYKMQTHNLHTSKYEPANYQIITHTKKKRNFQISNSKQRNSLSKKHLINSLFIIPSFQLSNLMVITIITTNSQIVILLLLVFSSHKPPKLIGKFPTFSSSPNLTKVFSLPQLLKPSYQFNKNHFQLYLAGKQGLQICTKKIQYCQFTELSIFLPYLYHDFSCVFLVNMIICC